MTMFLKEVEKERWMQALELSVLLCPGIIPFHSLDQSILMKQKWFTSYLRGLTDTDWTGNSNLKMGKAMAIISWTKVPKHLSFIWRPDSRYTGRLITLRERLSS